MIVLKCNLEQKPRLFSKQLCLNPLSSRPTCDVFISKSNVEDVYAGLMGAVHNLVFPRFSLLEAQLGPVWTLHDHAETTIAWEGHKTQNSTNKQVLSCADTRLHSRRQHLTSVCHLGLLHYISTQYANNVERITRKNDVLNQELPRFESLRTVVAGLSGQFQLTVLRVLSPASSIIFCSMLFFKPFRNAKYKTKISHLGKKQIQLICYTIQPNLNMYFKQSTYKVQLLHCTKDGSLFQGEKSDNSENNHFSRKSHRLTAGTKNTLMRQESECIHH